LSKAHFAVLFSPFVDFEISKIKVVDPKMAKMRNFLESKTKMLHNSFSIAQIPKQVTVLCHALQIFLF